MEGIRDGRPREALDRYVGSRYTQHSTGVGNGKEGFIEFFLPFIERTPKRDIRVLRTIEDGRFVFCHVFQSLNDGAAEWVTMDLFDTDEDLKIVEHWDVICAHEPTPSGAGMTAGPDRPRNLVETDSNKARIKEFTKRLLIEGGRDELPDFVAQETIEHSPRIEAGASGWRTALRSGAIGDYDMLFKLIGEGDLVATYSRVHRGGHDHAVFDLYRLANGLIVEHWDVSEEIGPRESWNNSGKF
ncbi:MAG: hypothetical protein GY937_25230 [bacterium]|nr:hypothetical protein [bacterium]